MNQQAKLKLGTLNYMVNMRPVFNVDALFSDETENYVMPMEPEAGDHVKIRFRGCGLFYQWCNQEKNAPGKEQGRF